MTQDQPVNWRALCEELVLGWDANGCDWKPQHQARWNATIERARATLAQPAPPAEGEVGEVGEVAELVAWLREQATWFAADDPGHENYDRAADLLSIAFATGAEAWEPIPQLPAQHQAAPVPAEALIQAYQAGRRDAEADAQQAAEAAAQDEPAEGGVAELVKTLRELAYPVIVGSGCAVKLRRAADLLEQRHPVPVPVSERLPGLGDCDAEGKVWGTAELGGWRLVHHSKIGLWRAWLPAHALPLPIAEV